MNPRQGSPSEIRSEDEAIRQILLKILDKWRIDEEGKKEELEKTVILSSKGIAKEIPPGPIQVKETQEMLAETVILSSKGIAKEIPPGPIQVKETQEMLAETVIFSQKETLKEPGKTSLTQKPQEEPKEDLFLKETIILKPDRGKDPQKK